MRMAAALARIRPVLHLRAFEEIGVLRLEVVIRDNGLRCHASHAQDVLDMLLSLKMRMKEEE